MPHIVIEHSANLAEAHDIQSLVDAVHAAALENGLPPMAGLRTRAVARTHYRIADGDPSHGFVAITARIGPGRTAVDKTAFLTCLIDTAEHELSGIAERHAIAFSVEIQEIDAEFRINRNRVRDRLATTTDPKAGA